MGCYNLSTLFFIAQKENKNQVYVNIRFEYLSYKIYIQRVIPNPSILCPLKVSMVTPFVFEGVKMTEGERAPREIYKNK